MEFSEIKTPKELKEYLNSQINENSEGNKSFSHYTSLDSAIKIFKSKSFNFSKLSKMNDILEYSWAGNIVPNEYYFCLSEGTENFGMWAMYGGLTKADKKEYVRLQIPRKSIARLLKNKTYNLSARKIIYTDLFSHKEEKSFVPEKIKISSSTCNNRGIEISKKDFAGFVKDKAWLYERELRLCYVSPSADEISNVKFDDEFLQSIEISLSPILNFEKCKTKFLGNVGESYNDNFKKSLFDGYLQQN